MGRCDKLEYTSPILGEGVNEESTVVAQNILCLGTRALVNGCQTGIYYIDTILPFLLRVMQSLIIMTIIMTIFDIEGIIEKKEEGQEGEQPWGEILNYVHRAVYFRLSTTVRILPFSFMQVSEGITQYPCTILVPHDSSVLQMCSFHVILHQY